MLQHKFRKTGKGLLGVIDKHIHATVTVIISTVVITAICCIGNSIEQDNICFADTNIDFTNLQDTKIDTNIYITNEDIINNISKNIEKTLNEEKTSEKVIYYDIPLSKELQDYTALLLNCYIMQEKFQKLKEFVDNEQKTFSDSDVKTAIDVCLENKETELALFIAKKKPQMCNEYLRILIVELNKYNEAIQYMKEKQNTEEKFKLLCEFGEYLLQEKEYEDQIYNMAIDIIKAINKDKADCKVDELAKIFANKKHLLRSVVDELMKNNPDQPIIHKHIELLLESCLEEEELKKKYEAKKKEIMDKDKITIMKW